MQWVVAELLGCARRCVHAHLCTSTRAARHAQTCTSTLSPCSPPVPPVLSWGSPHLPGPGPALSVSGMPSSGGPSSPRSSLMSGHIPPSPSVTRMMGAWPLAAPPSTAQLSLQARSCSPQHRREQPPSTKPPTKRNPQLSQDGEGDGGKPRGWERPEGAQLWHEPQTPACNRRLRQPHGKGGGSGSAVAHVAPQPGAGQHLQCRGR